MALDAEKHYNGLINHNHNVIRIGDRFRFMLDSASRLMCKSLAPPVFDLLKLSIDLYSPHDLSADFGITLYEVCDLHPLQ